MIQDLILDLKARLEARQPLAYCRLVETRGSTPQKAGAMMLVFEDGSQTGTLGGGCVEAEVKRRALAVLASGQAEVAKFQLDSDYGWDDGLICGGRMQILIVPLRDGLWEDYFGRLIRLAENGAGYTEAVLFDPNACNVSEPLVCLFDQDSELLAVKTLDAAAQSPENVELPQALIDNLRPVNARVRAYAVSGVGYLPTHPRCPLVIVGGGHVGQAVANLAVDLNFDVIVVDDRPEYVSPERFPRVKQRIAGNIETVLPALTITPDTYCLIVTRGHNHDEEALYYLVNRGARYVGLIGSRRKIKMIFADLLDEGVTAEALSQVYAPLGIDIGSQTVPEIAISICAELVSHRNRDGVVPGRPERIPVADALS